MPQAIRPGGYTSLYAQQLIQNILQQLSQMGGQQTALRNAPLIQNIDNAIGTTVISLDSQLSSVGIGLGSETQQPQPATFPATPALRLVNTDLASRGIAVGNAPAPVSITQPITPNRAIVGRAAAGGVATARTVAADVNRFSLFA